jgi:hypothetical protein
MGVVDCKKISQELIKMGLRDQKMRIESQNPSENVKFNPEVDKANTSRLKTIIDKIGWPTISKVGEEASYAAWLIAQHADHDVSFQKKCLKLMLQVKNDILLNSSTKTTKSDLVYDLPAGRQEPESNLVNKIPLASARGILLSNIAYLTDRVAVNCRKKQLYGTQFYQDREGKIVPRPISNLDKLDYRRRCMGLERFSKYEQKMKGEYKWEKEYKNPKVGRFNKSL